MLKRLITLVALFVPLTVIAFSGGRYFLAFKNAQEANNNFFAQTIQNQKKELSDAQLKLDLLIKDNQSVALKIEEEMQKRQTAEALAAAQSKQISSLEKNVAAVKTSDLTALVSEWRLRVATLHCYWNNIQFRAESGGSGVLFSGVSDTGFGIVTNRHVIDYQGVLPNNCTARFPSDPTTYNIDPNDMYYSSTESDWAILALTPTTNLKNVATKKSQLCDSVPSVGSQMIILGYPIIGSATDITATEGIVSGYENDYYITSAKVEKGNSGGAAILTSQNCYLGIPTFVGTGQIESLARVLKQQSIFR